MRLYIWNSAFSSKIPVEVSSAVPDDLAQTGEKKRYHGIARALFVYAAAVSQEAGFGGVVFFKAKTTRLREYYIQQFGAMPLGHYDPFRLIIWEDAAQRLIAEFCEEADTHD